MFGRLSLGAKPNRQGRRQLSVNQEPHAAMTVVPAI
jgi:hypothetical protein